MTIKTWLFDVDGTLTPPTAPMDEAFKAWFLRAARANTIVLVTGGNYDRTLAQVGPELMAAVHTCYNCMGNSTWRQGAEVAFRHFELPAQARAFLQDKLASSPYPVRAGNHIEARRGMVNFSVVGRQATFEQRSHYYHWDKEHGERVALAAEFEARFPHLNCQLGGEISMDIFEDGSDKAQVLDLVEGPVRFFGDQMAPGGIDHPLAQAIAERSAGSKSYAVSGWMQTRDILQQYAQAGLLALA